MPFKPNYNQRRAERRRAQQQKGEEKQRRREEKAAQRKVAQGEAPPATDDPGNSELGNIMGRNKQLPETGFVLFDVIYGDGTRSSNRKVAVAALDPLDADASARAIIEAQDRKISAMSGQSRGPVKAITRSAAR